MGKLINISFLKSKKQYVDVDAVIMIQPNTDEYYDQFNRKHENTIYRIKLITGEEYFLNKEQGDQIIKTKGLINDE